MSNYEFVEDETYLKKLENKPRIYKTDEMIYRLTRQDVSNVKDDSMNESEYKNIQVALNYYINEREKSIFSTRNLTNYMINAYGKEPGKDFSNNIYRVLLSYFYNVPYSRIAELKALKKGENLYRVMSFEELRFLSIMKNDILDKCNNKELKNKNDILAYAEELAKVGRSKFMLKYKVDPILVEIGIYNCDEIFYFSQFLEKKMKNKLQSTSEELIENNNQGSTQNKNKTKQTAKNVDKGREI